MSRPTYDERCDAIRAILDEGMRRLVALKKASAECAEPYAQHDVWVAEFREIKRLNVIARKRMKRLPQQQDAA